LHYTELSNLPIGEMINSYYLPFAVGQTNENFPMVDLLKIKQEIPVKNSFKNMLRRVETLHLVRTVLNYATLFL
jgi:hypothetical protein